MKFRFLTKIAFISCIAMLPLVSAAQEMWGIANSNYAGNMGMHLNPASMVGAPYKYEINLIAGDLFFENNYLYWKNFSEFTGGEKVYDTYTSNDKHAYLSELLIGPSVIYNKGDRAYALHTALRSVASVNGMPYHLAKTFYDDFHYQPQHGVVYDDTRMRAAALMFGDVGFSYGQVMLDKMPHWMSWGATLRGIVAFNGAYFDGHIASYMVPDSSTWVIDGLDLDYAHASPTFGNSTSSGDLLAIRGAGASIDAGIIYIRKRLSQAYKCDRDADKVKRYQYRVGLSLMDIGYVSFFNEASRFRINSGSTIWYGIDSLKVKSAPGLDQSISNQFFGMPAATRSSNKFGMFMPAAASIQFDFCWAPRWYSSLSVVQRIPLTAKEVWRANQVAFVPRYETRRFEASASAHLYEYQQLSAGVGVRWWIFVLGTDRLLTFFGSEVRNFDFFFGFRWNSCTMNAKKKTTGQCPFD